MRSDNVKKGMHKAPHRSLLYATGVSKEGMKRPFIGIASSFSDLVPGHVGMRELERQIEKGIHTGGGQAFIFGVPAVCDGIAMGHSGMKYSLPSRDLIADCVETVAGAHQLDGLVLLTNCDKITPGMLIAALRMDIPCIVVTAGPMLDGCSKKEVLTMIRGSFEAIGKFSNGDITEERLYELKVLIVNVFNFFSADFADFSSAFKALFAHKRTRRSFGAGGRSGGRGRGRGLGIFNFFRHLLSLLGSC